MHYRLRTLKNGLRVVFLPLKGSLTTTAVVMTGTGSRYENARENGLAHFLEHMFFKGTKKRPSALSISRELDAMGSSYNAYTAKDRTAYHAKVANEYVEQALDVLFDLYLHSTLPPHEITKERGAVLQEISMYEDMPVRTIDTVFDALIFGDDHPLGRTILGSKENIGAFTKSDFTGYLSRNYSASNAVIAIAGSCSERAVMRIIRDQFSALPSGAPPSFIRFHSEQRESRVSIKAKSTDQTQLMLGVPAYPYQHKDEYALFVLSTILGGGMSSRLFTEVREKRGLAYSIHASTDRYADTGYLSIQSGVEHGKTELALKTILTELKKISSRLVPETELQRTKSYLKGMLAISLETSDALAENAASALITTGNLLTIEERMSRIDSVQASDIKRVANDIFRSERLNLALIGPHKGKADVFKHLLAV